jgi:hypothetical protein
MIRFKTMPLSQATKEYHLVLISGSGRNVGKTTFAATIIQHLVELKLNVLAVKITPHFHHTIPPFCIFSSEHFILSLEKDATSAKDTGRFLRAGATDTFFLQVQDFHLAEAFEYTSAFFPPGSFVVVESGGLAKILKPDYHFFIQPAQPAEIKPSALEIGQRAHQIIHFDGIQFDFEIEKIRVDHHKLIWNA